MKKRSQSRFLWWGCLLSLLLVTFFRTPWVQAADLLSDESYEESRGTVGVKDPIEPVNRAFFIFNDRVHSYVLHPVATGYSKVLPGEVRGCVSNFFSNLNEPVRSVNCLLQGRIRDSGRALARFVLNSICGVFGLADAADEAFGVSPVSASFGETLEVWGLGEGFYLVMPFLGPSTLRDFSGSVVDSLAASTYSPWHDDFVTSATVTGGKTVNRTSLHLGEYEDLKRLSIDPYIAIRNGYYQMRAKERAHSSSTN